MSQAANMQAILACLGIPCLFQTITARSICATLSGDIVGLFGRNIIEWSGVISRRYHIKGTSQLGDGGCFELLARTDCFHQHCGYFRFFDTCTKVLGPCELSSKTNHLVFYMAGRYRFHID